ncbi:uncharacterized protein LOC143430569 [Xylocopa sonorina]|uniref:uncharacterized protein LOC143430569 n=1 Tax=Xylocopa sonorina TaxID=1818115 RepID=UPI00403ADD0E
MFRNVTAEKAIAFTHLCVALTYCWPLPSMATRRQVLRFKILRFVLFLNALMLLFPLLYAMHVHRDDAGNVGKAGLLTLGVMLVLSQTSLSIVEYERFQRLIEEMEYYCKRASLYQRRVFQRYIDKYSTFYGVSAVWFYATACMVILGTVFLSDPLPTNAEYPFAVTFEPVRSIIFVHQAIVGFQCAAHISIGIFCALLLLFSAARFEVLTMELRTVQDTPSLIECVKHYRAAKRYAKEVISSIRSITLITVTMCGVATVFCGITFIGRQPFAVKVQFLSLASLALLKVFMCAWPADHLMDTSENVMHGVYESKWYKRPLRMQKFILFMLVPQAPVTLSIKSIIPTLSLNYYTSFISNVFSLFTVLRAAMVRYNDNN